MPEPIVPTPSPDAAELAVLRKTNTELLTKSHAQKARIAELENQALQLTESADKAKAAAHAVVVEQPLKKMVAELHKNLPDLVMRELLEDYAFDAADGTIAITNKADGKPIAAKDGKPVEWNAYFLHKFLIGDGYAEKSDRQKFYTALLGIPTGSGGIGREQSRQLGTKSPELKKELQPLPFGLR